jgi:hypothetical protein
MVRHGLVRKTRKEMSMPGRNSLWVLMGTLVPILMTALSCAAVPRTTVAVNDAEVPGVVVKRVDNSNYTLALFIDGKKVGELEPGAVKGYELNDGQHTLHTYYVPSYLSNVMNFTVNNDRHYVLVNMERNDYGRIRVSEEGKTSGGGGGSLIDEAVNNSFAAVSQDIPERTKIAIVNISSRNKAESDYVMDELSVLFVTSRKYTIVDRSALDIIKQEQNFQMSGDADDADVISIGKFSGAEVVITGTINGESELKRLRLKALDVKTAQILAQSSERM